MLHLDSVIGLADDPDIAERLHRLEHDGAVEIVRLAPRDAARSRIRAETDKGTDCAIMLPRGTQLPDGAVLALEDTRAIIVRLGAEEWLTLRPRDAEAALALGYHAGNLHLRVRFNGADLLVAAEPSRKAVLARMEELLNEGQVEVVND